jgi:cystathionine gamma-synthase
VVGGAVVAKTPELAQQLSWWANCNGLTGAPFDSFLTLRGLRTLGPRLRAHQEGAAAVVELLARHEAVAQVYYPGLAEHPQHALAARQQAGFGAMVSFELDADVAGIEAFCCGLRCFSLAESLGGVESLVAHPASMTHASMAPEARRNAGIADNLLRLSVGIEDPRDLVADLAQGLERARSAKPRQVRA